MHRSDVKNHERTATVAVKIVQFAKKTTTYTLTSMAKYKLEYIWLDGYEPVPNLRSKTQIKEFDELSEAGGVADVGF